MNEKIKTFLKLNIGYVIVGLTSAVYILTAFLRIDESGKTVGRIIADGAVCFFLGIFFNRILGLQGMMSGDRDERVRVAVNEHGKMVMTIAPYIDKLDAWCDEENAKNYISQRTRILARCGLKYDDCFDASGVAKPYTPNLDHLKNKYMKREEKARIRGYRKAVNLRLTALKPRDLTGEGGKEQDPFYFGRTKVQYETQGTLADVVIKILMAILFGYYGVTLIADFDYANLIWMTLQVMFFLVMGTVQMYKNYNFVTGEYRGRIIKKIDTIQRFINYIDTTSHEREENISEELSDGT